MNLTLCPLIGANQGIGYECAKNLVLSSATYHVLLGSRSLGNGHKAAAKLSTLPDLKGSVEALQIDVTDQESIAEAVEQVQSVHQRLDVLVNNAGIGESSTSGPSYKRLHDLLATNTIGPVMVTENFLPLLRKSSSPRIVFVSSSGGSLTHAADPKSPYYGSKTGMQHSHYRASKAALNMLLIESHKMLWEEGFAIMGADPGLVVTNFLDAEKVRALGAPEADVGGRTVAEVVRGERDTDMGRVVGRYGVSPC